MGVAVGKLNDRRPCTGDLTLNISMDFEYDYDLLVIGGGSGGLAAAKRAAKLGKRVALCDFVKPSPVGTTWGLGGTCVNVGCIPKKLMHQAALLGQGIEDSSFYGWGTGGSELSHDWEKMVTGIQEYIQSLNWGYKVTLQKDEVDYFNAFAQFIDPHTVLLEDDKKEEPWTVTAEHVIIAVGGRPRYLNIPGGRPGEFCITSDDIFSLPYNPGKVLLVGGSYVALECAGFLAGIGLDVTVMVRSILLRGFDQQVAEMIGDCLERHGIRLLRETVPIQIEEVSGGTPPQLLVSYQNVSTQEVGDEVFNTIVLAVGRDPCTADLQLGSAGVEINPENEKILTDEKEQTNVRNIFAIGDVAEGRPELTPAAIQAGKYLVDRLYGDSNELVDYINVPTTVFTPLEYGCIGYSEENAIDVFGADNIEVYHLTSQPLEFTLPAR
jgi:thioredoxin/glutathione reductase (selenoprotein)